MRHTTKGLIATLVIVLAAAILAAPAAAQSDLATRTPTELGQRVDNYSLPTGPESGFDWAAAAVVGGVVLVLALGTRAVLSRRHQAIQASAMRVGTEAP